MSGGQKDTGQYLKSIGIDLFPGAVGGGVGEYVAPLLPAGKFIRGYLTGYCVGGASGFTSGALNSWLNGGSFIDGLKAGILGGSMGALMGGISEAIRGYEANLASLGSGKYIDEVGGTTGGGAFLDEEIPAGAKPTVTGEVARTSSNPSYGKYGMTRNGGTKAHYGVDYAGEVGDDITAMYDGTVTQIGGSKAYGDHFVRVSSSINGKMYNVDYGHMSSHAVSLKESVIAGETIIGKMGRLGNLTNSSFPTHVHISVWRPVNGLQGFVMPSFKK